MEKLNSDALFKKPNLKGGITASLVEVQWDYSREEVPLSVKDMNQTHNEKRLQGD